LGLGGEFAVIIFIAVMLVVFLYDFMTIRKQNNTIIEQNGKIISLLEEIKDK
jgi:ABC-type bacteriocin/lantibiotic exporter with double-glycine peptidase domain